MKGILTGVATLALAGILSGCGKEVPSCGDVEATNMVGQITAKLIEGSIPAAIDQKYRKPVHFVVEQPVVVSHDEKLGGYSCKAVAVYQLPDTVLAAQQRGTSDKDYGEAVNFKWRELMGLYSGEDVSNLVGSLFLAIQGKDIGADISDVREALRRAIHANADADDRDLIIAAGRFPAKQRSQQLSELAGMSKVVYNAADKATHKVSVGIDYTIAKIDGQQKFKVEASFQDGDLAKGIRNLEVLQSAVLVTNEPSTSEKSTKDAQSATGQATAAQAAAVKTAPTQSEPTNSEAGEAPPSQAEAVQAKPTQSQSAGAAAQSETKQTTIEASFDCAKAASNIEKLICSTPEAANADKRLAAAYSAAKSKSADANALKAEQVEWMKQQRNACGDSACLLNVTEKRIQTLSQM